MLCAMEVPLSNHSREKHEADAYEPPQLRSEGTLIRAIGQSEPQ